MTEEVNYVLNGGALKTIKFGKLELPAGCAEAETLRGDQKDSE